MTRYLTVVFAAFALMIGITDARAFQPNDGDTAVATLPEIAAVPAVVDFDHAYREATKTRQMVDIDYADDSGSAAGFQGFGAASTIDGEKEIVPVFGGSPRVAIFAIVNDRSKQGQWGNLVPVLIEIREFNPNVGPGSMKLKRVVLDGDYDGKGDFYAEAIDRADGSLDFEVVPLVGSQQPKMEELRYFPGGVASSGT